MKPHIIFYFSLFFVSNLLGQTNVYIEQPMPDVLIPASTFNSFQRYTNFTQMLLSYFAGDEQTNINIIVNNPKSCPPEYTNIISNTNLFSPAEQKLLAELPLEYKDVTTNSPPKSSIFIGIDKSENPFFMEGFTIGRFQYTNSGDQFEIIFNNYGNGKGRAIGVSLRTKSGDGYEALFNGTFRQFKHWQLDGLWVDFDRGHCAAWMRFKDGNAIGKWLVWNQSGSLYMEAEFKEPFDFIGHLNFSP